jgi:hypothetical protein
MYQIFILPEVGAKNECEHLHAHEHHENEHEQNEYEKN